MTDKQIMEAAMLKAIDGGFKKDGFMGFPHVTNLKPYESDIDRSHDHHVYIEVGTFLMPYEALIFNRDFAKALWPNEWERRFKLAMIVNSEEPIKRLGEYI